MAVGGDDAKFYGRHFASDILTDELNASASIARDRELAEGRRRSVAEEVDTDLIELGHRDEVFRWMEKCYVTHSTTMTSLKVNPDYDELREDPRFAKYVGQVGLLN